MTIQEAKSTYGAKVYITCQGDTLTKIVDRIYKDRSSHYYYIITELNPHVDWLPYTLIPHGIEIQYIDKDACTQIYEVVG